MNNVFSINRFVLLLRKTLFERSMQLFGLLVLSLSLVFITYVLCKWIIDFEVAQNASFMLGLVGGGCFMASFVFGYFSTNAMGSSFLTLPASQLEKWLCGVLITGLLYVGIFLVFFRLMDLSFVSLYHQHLDPAGPFYKDLYEEVRIFPFNGFVMRIVVMMFLNFSGSMLIGSLYFNKNSFLKVALLICVLCFGTFLLNLLIAGSMIRNVQQAMPYNLVWVKINMDEGRIEMPEKIAYIIKWSVMCVIPSMLWLLAYLRLREKEF